MSGISTASQPARPAAGAPAPWGAVAGDVAKAAPRAGAAEARLRGMVDGHFDFIWRSLRRLGVAPGDVDDCTQQVFMIAARKLDAIATGCERSFLFGTALRVASDARRTRTRRREVLLEGGPGCDAGDGDADRLCDPGLTPEEMVEQRQRRARLDEVLAQMSMDLRTVFVLFELEEMSTQQIAELLEIPGGTAASRLRRAREEFQRLAARVTARERGGKR